MGKILQNIKIYGYREVHTKHLCKLTYSEETYAQRFQPT